MIIDGREISSRFPPYIIAEISCNHNGSLDKALKLINAAKQAGADAVKFQAYTPDTITLDHDSEEFRIQGGPWNGRRLHKLYSQTHTPFEWFPRLFEYAAERRITIFSSVFDKSSVDMLGKLGCPAFKIASMEITDLPLIRYAASTGKPLIISTGMATEKEIDEAFAETAYIDVIGLACVSGYPTKIEDANLDKIGNSYFVRGISDHSVGHLIPAAATARGAQMIEKHLMLGDELTEDFEFSCDPTHFRVMVNTVHKIWKALQPKKINPAEDSSRQLRRSLYVVADIKQGEPFTEDNVRSIRPAYGLPPKELPWVLTKSAAVDLKRGTALKFAHISSKTSS